MKNVLIVGFLVLFLCAVLGWAIYAWIGVGDVQMSVHGYIAMTLGIVFSLLVGFGLMGLVFYSHRHGYDEPIDFSKKRAIPPRGKSKPHQS